MGDYTYLIVVATAVVGFFIAWHIYRTKRAEQKLVCPIGFECDPVVHSSFSHIMGIPLEVGGMCYYAATIIAYTTLFVFPTFLSDAVSIGALVVSGGAFLFSLYLTGVQAFALREWCSWCLASAGTSATIFAVALWIFVL